jgi:hypothetical protein
MPPSVGCPSTLRPAGRNFQKPQAIAATAHALTVVTRNVRNFEGCDVPVLDPWQFA